MAEVFSDDWMSKYTSLWNNDNEHVAQLASSEFSSNVGFGLVGEDQPRVTIEIKEGAIVQIKAFDNEVLDWDIRGEKEFWAEVSLKAPSLMKLGLAYTTRKLKFIKGDYTRMIKDPGLSSAFIKCFKFMSSVYN